MKIAYVGIDLLYPALPALMDVGCEVIKIFSCQTDNKTEFNVKVTTFARQKQIPYTLKKITQDDLDTLKKEGCDALICAGYYFKLPLDDVLPMVNIHPTLLPTGRGAWPMPLIIMKELKESGVTIHKVTEELDAGDILIQRSFAVERQENLVSYMEKVYALLPEMVRLLVSDLGGLYANAKPQGEGEYWAYPPESIYTITSEMTAKEADKILRAFYGYECFYKISGETYEIIEGVLAVHKREGYQYFPLKDGMIEAKRVKKLTNP